jgi:predicted dehydrogenase
VKVFDPGSAGFERARTAAGGGGFRACSSRDEFWEELDAVSVCSPDATHAAYVEEALGRGLHVLCEKPLTDSLDGIRRIKRAQVAAASSVVAVLHQMRFVPVHRRMKEALGRGELGVISYLEGYYLHDLVERAFRYGDWREKDAATLLVNAGCHFVDLLRWLAEDEVAEVSAAANHRVFPRYPEADLVLATLTFRSGLLGKVLVAVGSSSPQDHSVRVYGRDGCIDNTMLFRHHRWVRTLHLPVLVEPRLLPPHGRLRRNALRYAQLRRNVAPWLVAQAFDLLRRLGPPSDGEYGLRHFPVRLYEHELACTEAIADFVAAARFGVAPACGLDDAARTVLACLAGVEAQRTRRPVAVPTLDSVL